MTVKKGDQVVVISGRDADRGKVGKVLRVIPKTNRVVVEGVHIVTRHQKPTMQGQKGSLVKKEAPIHRSRVMLYDPSLKKGVRVRHKELENGQKVRVSHKSGETLDN
ncbi:50S ribosomal protein L24 [bacterium (Candidatus Blackallbacteria) CG17_big_fil_post_rev_8_21_14_2_50_48_46]|uniref:Large ribosomal subunit protein uL24 n=1 Tax=bacterium (Candidatus Blackallbacteria) CG17_big_fil_post_rev_8_21_14_2_50_48_46 TaxID=2014261 RepID=A0A2M7G176_9BACT|nr:MAG: 50S ribosomal protein L24 [bacterium (Candidatus Blackallbacteria) CG18_big_fil_WC_8_21_14_2_50_49_26]PIW15458.1 MAG: 50S ribosomal protein L24 [bacterium (Candidatus Blackallbacteria) CG17_big_fil_post_rev_8_21_14_2_50_48_46]PIW49815.1 MAG: 50S ribosomal protein L24 [bacterium (Candidatus Blackallbacteria) CG13_big_fil_rev_8_21_14_2_50_49_14]